MAEGNPPALLNALRYLRDLGQKADEAGLPDPPPLAPHGWHTCLPHRGPATLGRKRARKRESSGVHDTRG